MRFSDSINQFTNYRQFRVGEHTVQRYDRLLRIFALYLRDPEIESVRLEDILCYLATLKRMGWAPNGINLICIGIKKFFEFYFRQGYKVIDDRLIPLPRRTYNIPRVASEESYKKLVRAIPKNQEPHNVRNLALIGLTWDSGARIGEVLSLDVDDLDLVRRKAMIKTEKARNVRRPIRQIFWSKSTNAKLKKWLRIRKGLTKQFAFQDGDALFISISNCTHYDVRGRRMTNRGANEALRVTSNRANIKHVNPHSMRHYMARDILEKGGTPYDIMNILGHARLDSSEIYTLMFGEQLHNRYKAFREDVKYRKTVDKHMKRLAKG